MDDKFKRKDKEENVEIGISEVGEDATKYGEFISTYFAWISLPEQKENAERMQNITKNKNKKGKQRK